MMLYIAALIQAGLFTYHWRRWRRTGETTTFSVGFVTVAGSIYILGKVMVPS